MLATARVRGQIKAVARAEHSITVQTGSHRFGAVDLPSSMTTEEMGQTLQELGAITVLIGDINTSLQDPRYQHGLPGLRERLDVLATYLERCQLVPAWPRQRQTSRPYQTHWTTDHCFAHTATEVGSWSTSSLAIYTDYRYLLACDFSPTKSPPWQ